MSDKNEIKPEKGKKERKMSWMEIWELTKTSFIEFFKGDSFMHGAALAYYAVFALVPIIYLAVTFFGKIVGQDRVIEIVADLLESNMGMSEVSTITDLMYRWDIGVGGTPIIQVVGLIALAFTATAMFNSLSKSLNFFFGVTNTKAYSALLRNLIKRLISFGLMALFGVIILVIYFAQSVLISIGARLLSNGSKVQDILFSLLEHFSIITINFLAFTFVFKFLHDGRVKWKLAMTGAVFTAVLLYFGQLVINYYLANYFFAKNSGVAGTLLAVLTWIFYTSQIIFLGAKYMSVYARMTGMPIQEK